MRWHDANTTGVEALAAAIEELMAGRGADEVGAEGALGVEAFEDDSFGSEGLAEDFVTEDFAMRAHQLKALAFEPASSS